MDETTTKLFEAIRAHDEKMVEEALSSGADIESSLGNFKPLMFAALHSDIKILNILLENNADINATNNKGANALLYTAFSLTHETEPCMSALIKQGIDLNAEDDEGHTVLMHSTELLQVENVKHLINNGADPEYMNSKGITALDIINNLSDTDAKTTIARILETAISKKQLEEKKIKAHQTVKRHKHQANFRRFALNRGHKR